MNQKNYITPEGLAKLKEEYHQLMYIERPKVVETVTWAASNGDRSENADYIYGKRRLREIDSRARFLKGRLEKTEVIDPKTLQSDKVVFGATVTLTRETVTLTREEEGEVLTYQIVGEDESDAKNRKISWKSPVARALLGKKEGDEISIQKPNGEVEFAIIEKISFK